MDFQTYNIKINIDTHNQFWFVSGISVSKKTKEIQKKYQNP